jgi:CzcA family heavy metal efflux pump
MKRGGLASWAIRHPVSTVMLTLTVVVLGLFALGRLSVDLLPHLIYPQIRVRILDPGVSAKIMEDRVTRQLEEQLAITEDATGIDSSTSEGATSVNLYFDYGKDIDLALRDASTRLDRAKRFLPTTIDPPIIYKLDPSQIPVMEFIVSSPLRDMVELRQWTDDVFSKRFLTVPGVASVEVGGGVQREIQILPDQRRLAALGLSVEDLVYAIQRGNEDVPAGRMQMAGQEYGGRTAGRLTSVGAIANLPIRLPNGDRIALSEVARVLDTNEDERIRVRYDGVPGVKMSIQKQPNANTVDVADEVRNRLAWARANGLVPEDIHVSQVSDQSVYVRRSLNNASMAALSGAILAMVVVYAFLGNIRGTLIIGTAIPISILVTFVIMALGGLTLNVMTLGGLALGVGMLIDNTIVMLENITRHKQTEPEKDAQETSTEAAGEVASAILASTSTNLSAVLPFLFISGLVGLLFRELIFTISAAIVASLVVALTLVPSLAARMPTRSGGVVYERVNALTERARNWYASVLEKVLNRPWLTVVPIVLAFALAMPTFLSDRQAFLPKMDEGQVRVTVTVDPGISIDTMDATVASLEKLARKTGDVEGVFTLVGGSIFGRTERQTPNRSDIRIQLVPRHKRSRSSEEWIKDFNKAVAAKQLAGVKVRTRATGIRGLRTSRGDDDLSIRVQGPNLETLAKIGDDLVARIKKVKGLRNVKHSMEEVRQEFAIKVDRDRASELGIDVADIGRALRFALNGVVVSDFVDGDRSYNIRVRLPQADVDSPMALGNVLLFGELKGRPAVYLRDVAKVELVPSPATIMHEDQRRMVEVSASLTDRALGAVINDVKKAIADYPLPRDYFLYFGGADETLRKGQSLTQVLIFLALFLVFVVMAVQYESLRNPTIIMICVPFSLVGVALGIWISRIFTTMPISMPIWLGIIMLVGIVVNNAIVLVEYFELQRSKGMDLRSALLESGRLRLRPILMTTLTTVVGMLPLALGIGEGAEMLQPLAVAIVSGLSFSMLVSLLLVPVLYQAFNTPGGIRQLLPEQLMPNRWRKRIME